MADSALRPQPDSRIAWAMVTEAGTPKSRRPRCAPGTAEAMNCALVSTGGAVGTGPGHRGNAPVAMYACATKRPSVSLSH